MPTRSPVVGDSYVITSRSAGSCWRSNSWPYVRTTFRSCGISERRPVKRSPSISTWIARSSSASMYSVPFVPACSPTRRCIPSRGQVPRASRSGCRSNRARRRFGSGTRSPVRRPACGRHRRTSPTAHSRSPRRPARRGMSRGIVPDNRIDVRRPAKWTARRTCSARRMLIVKARDRKRSSTPAFFEERDQHERTLERDRRERVDGESGRPSGPSTAATATPVANRDRQDHIA